MQTDGGKGPVPPLLSQQRQLGTIHLTPACSQNWTSPFGMTLQENSRALQQVISEPDPADHISIFVESAIAEWVQKLKWPRIGVDSRIPMPIRVIDD
jgi:hypothetical protein